jgi:hypothetical protein
VSAPTANGPAADAAGPAAAAGPSLLYAWYVVGVLFLAQTFSFLDRMIMGLLVGPIRQSFDISDTQYSLLAGLRSPCSTPSWACRWRASPTPGAAAI